MRSGRNRALLFLYSTPNLVGAALGLVGLALFFLGVIRDYWLFIVLGLYGVGYLMTPKNKPVDLRLKEQLGAEEIARELNGLVAAVRGRVPPEVLEKVLSIQTSVVGVLPTLARLEAVNSRDGYAIRETALTYLPETLEHYLNLPPAFARLHTLKDGKTAQQILLEQLSLLDATMKEVSENVYRNDTDRLRVNGRFLEETFRKSELTL